MKKKNVSAVVSIGNGARRITGFFSRFFADGVTVHAAQATFYTILASIPFLMLLISISGRVAPEAIDSLFLAIRRIIPERFEDFFTVIYTELMGKADISLLSTIVITAVWSCSRSIASIISGVAFIYDADYKPGIVRRFLSSIIYTIAFISLIVGALVVLVFGVFLQNLLILKFPQLEWIFTIIIDLRSIIFFVLLTLFFSLVYFTVSKNILKSSGTLRFYRSQLPGALFASLGWTLFSYFFSLYIKYFPSASYIYGSLATIILMMLWLYFCMIILLAGAEINKILFLKDSHHS